MVKLFQLILREWIELIKKLKYKCVSYRENAAVSSVLAGEMDAGGLNFDILNGSLY